MLILVFVAKIYFFLFFVFCFLWRQHASFEKYIFFYILNYYNSKIIWTHLNIHYTHSLIKFYSTKKNSNKITFQSLWLSSISPITIAKLASSPKTATQKVGFNFINEINVLSKWVSSKSFFLVLNPSEPLCYGRTTWASHPYLTFQTQPGSHNFWKDFMTKFQKEAMAFIY